jgi:hypothetical protein
MLRNFWVRFSRRKCDGVQTLGLGFHGLKFLHTTLFSKEIFSSSSFFKKRRRKIFSQVFPRLQETELHAISTWIFRQTEVHSAQISSRVFTRFELRVAQIPRRDFARIEHCTAQTFGL